MSQALRASSLLLVLCRTSAVEAFQGMASPARAPRTIDIRTNLAPIKIDFRDIAVEAGLTAQNVSGGKDEKKYILETTGSGVAIFDFDNDGLMDVFLVNATTMDGKGDGAKATSQLYKNHRNMP